MTVRRDLVDPAKFKNVKVMDSGFIKVPVFATRTGVFVYQRADGTIVRELRHPDDVFKQDSLETLEGVPLTSRHPKDLVNTDNAKGLTVGVVSDLTPKKDGIFVATHATIMDRGAINEVIQDGIEEVSCGYECDVIDESGVFEREDGVKEKYDARQKNIRYNHLAIVPRGRAGSEVRFRLDSNNDLIINHDKENVMKVKIGDKEFEMEEDAAKAVKDALSKKDSEIKDLKNDKKDSDTKADEAKVALEKSEAKADGLETEKKSLEADLVKAKKESKVDAKQLNELAKERKDICDVATKILGEEVKFDDKENYDIKKEVVAKVSPELKIDEKSETYIEARFDHISETADLHKDHLAEAINKKKNDDANKTVPKTDAELKADREAKAKEAHKAPLSMSKK